MSDTTAETPALRPTDTQDPDFQRFVQCFVDGAALQDIYTSSTHGFAAPRHDDPDDPVVHEGLLRDARKEFERVREHLRNLALPLDQAWGLAGRETLDFGCGMGALSVAMAACGARVRAVDPTPLSLQAARARARYFRIADELLQFVPVQPQPGLPFADGSFDRVVTNSVLEFIPHGRDAHVAELLRVLRPGGLLVVSCENGLFPTDYYTGMLLPRLRRARCRAENFPYGPTWLELRRWARASGRRVEDLSAQNRFNSFDKLVTRLAQRGRHRTARAVGLGNRAFKATFRAVGLPSDLLLPYATYAFRVLD